MELVRGLHNLRSKHHGCVLTIGKFDGVHLGHQAVLANVCQEAEARQLPATVMVFEPQPEEFFAPQRAPARLSRLRDKYNELRRIGIDRLLCMRFDQHFASWPAEAFIRELLVERLGVKFLVVGDDFRFGQGRQGDFAMLLAAGKQYGFEVVSTQSFRLEDCRISSSAVRDALKQGDLASAQMMLGRPYSIAGKVVHGQKKGRTIGFPTANVLLKRCVSPVSGVFAVTVNSAFGQFFGVANIGTRPTVDGVKPLLEVHIFDFDQHLYGQQIEVVLGKKLRDELKFDSFEHLKKQIEIDVQQARDFYRHN
ncbi:bifunctional riboflavin kinase/FAD synthetase [Bowmanella sp. JS7-9]|uniref:Riboflavin biosynthesis protein n=1 Tax=Pseudobowmanella zhangzhouensis TaxID=1537679 RepID=A0ABW1XGL2_9ALTE|nr:bifunctional riboflavin kinase/FAD synthetase [Bowmanella sp. JS7-9]TBX21100.1 FMN adenylyltransferase [Bowmanella sp. JS7-9]